MSKIACAALVTIVFAVGLAAGLVVAQETDSGLSHYQTGQSYRERPHEFRLGYAAGAMDAFALASYARAIGRKLRDFSECSAEWTIGTVVSIVDTYMADNTQSWSQSAALLAHSALNQACVE